MTETNIQNDEQPRLPMQGVPQPKRDEVLGLPRVHVSTHPIIAHKTTALRDKNRQPDEIYHLMKEIGMLLAFEATASLTLEPSVVETPLAQMTGYRIAKSIGVAPILRAGIGLADGFREVIPDVHLWHLGLRRDKQTLQAIEYYNPLPPQVNLQVCYVVDPLLGTGNSAIEAINMLKRCGIPCLSYVGIMVAPFGLLKLTQTHPDIDIYIAAIDEKMNDYGYLVPGMGDAGDRQFWTF